MAAKIAFMDVSGVTRTGAFPVGTLQPSRRILLLRLHHLRLLPLLRDPSHNQLVQGFSCVKGDLL